MCGGLVGVLGVFWVVVMTYFWMVCGKEVLFSGGLDVRGIISVVLVFAGACFVLVLSLFGDVMAVGVVVSLKIFLWLGKFIV